MKIIKLKELGKGKYELTLSNDEKIKLNEEIIINNRLLEGKEIDYKLMEKIRKENSEEDIYNMALSYISYRMRSIYEMRKYLEGKNIDGDLLDKVIDRLKKHDLLDDKKFVIALTNTKIKTTNHGPLRVKKELMEKMIDGYLINIVDEIYSADIEKEKIEKLAKSDIKRNKKYSSIMLKKKIIDRLMYLGYNMDNIMDVINNVEIEDNDESLKKEYLKLAKKYDNNKIKRKLISLGYSYSDILEFMNEE